MQRPLQVDPGGIKAAGRAAGGVGGGDGSVSMIDQTNAPRRTFVSAAALDRLGLAAAG
jgi:hypothetical protein